MGKRKEKGKEEKRRGGRNEGTMESIKKRRRRRGKDGMKGRGTEMKEEGRKE